MKKSSAAFTTSSAPSLYRLVGRTLGRIETVRPMLKPVFAPPSEDIPAGDEAVSGTVRLLPGSRQEKPSFESPVDWYGVEEAANHVDPVPGDLLPGVQEPLSAPGPGPGPLDEVLLPGSAAATLAPEQDREWQTANNEQPGQSMPMDLGPAGAAGPAGPIGPIPPIGPITPPPPVAEDTLLPLRTVEPVGPAIKLPSKKEAAASGAPNLKVTIGRIDVRAVSEARPPVTGLPGTKPAKSKAPRETVLSLQDYLKMRNGGQR